jgi:hypothetical protein
MQAVITWFSGKPEFLSAKNLPSAESNCLTYLDSCLLKGLFFKVKLAFCFCDRVPDCKLKHFPKIQRIFSLFQVPKPCPNLSSNQPDAVKESNKSTGRNFVLKNHQLRLFGAPLILNVEPEKPSQMKKKRGSGFGQRRFRKCYVPTASKPVEQFGGLLYPQISITKSENSPEPFSGDSKYPSIWSSSMARTMILGWNTSTYEVLIPEALTDATTQVGTERNGTADGLRVTPHPPKRI